MFESKSVRETCALLDTDADRGLSEREAARRYQANGKNELQEPRKKSLPEAFLEQLNDPLIYVLLAAAIISRAKDSRSAASESRVQTVFSACVQNARDLTLATESQNRSTAPRRHKQASKRP